MALFERDAEDVLVFLLGADVVGVDLDDVVVALLLRLEDLESLIGVTWGDDAVGNLELQVVRDIGIAYIRKSGPVAIRAKAIGTACADVGAGDGGELAFTLNEINLAVRFGKGQPHSGAGGAHVFERSGGRKTRRLLELADQLP